MQFGSVNAIGVGVVAAALFTFTAAPVARAAETVAAGETLAFTEAEGGVRVCRIADTIIPELAVLGCGDLGTVWRGLLPVPAVIPNPFDVILTRFDTSANEAEAAFQNTLGLVPGQFGLPYYSSAAVYNDFTIDDPLGIGNVLDAQFEIKFSWEGGNRRHRQL